MIRFSTAATARPAPASATPLRGRALVLARALWIAIAVLTVLYVVASTPLEFARLRTVCLEANCQWGVLGAANGGDLYARDRSASFFAAYFITVELLFAVVSFATGAVIFWRKSNNRMGLYASLALITFGVLTLEVTPEVIAGGSRTWWFLFSVVRFLGNFAIIPFFYLFPDGSFVPRWTRVLAAMLVALTGCYFLVPGASTWPWLDLLVTAVFLLSLAVAVFAQLYRYRRVSGPAQRQQTKWVVAGVAAAMAGYLVGHFLIPLLDLSPVMRILVANTTAYLAELLIPLSIGIAILRYGLWEIDILINRTLVYGALTACVVVLYVMVVGSLGALFQTRGSLLVSLVATGVVAVAFQPLRAYLQQSVNHLFYGERDDPYAVLSRLGERLEATLAPEAVLPTIVETVKEALKLPYVAITLATDDQRPTTDDGSESTVDSSTIAAASGSPVGNSVRLPLVHQGETVGELVLAPRTPGETFGAADRRLLQDLAHQIGVAVHAVRLTADLQRLTTDLQRSRERLVLAREEERRRLRRDLHDGLGPTLAALALTASNVGDLIPTNPSAATALATELQNEIRATVADIRRLVYDLRPPALDELGLVAAIRERAIQIGGRESGVGSRRLGDGGRRTEDGGQEYSRLQVVVEAPEYLPPLPAAVEVAAYRIVQEALTNVIRHAQAHTCAVRLSLTDALEVEIVDDGAGLPPEHPTGVGLLSMRERAAELGGSCVIERNNGNGTRVYARLPVGALRARE